MKLAIITCRELPQGVADDQLLFAAIRKTATTLDILAWDANVDWATYDACLLRSVWDYHERQDDFNRWLTSTDKVTRIINPPEVIRWNQNKSYLAELADFGVTIAPTTWINQQQSFDLKQWVEQQTAQQFFLKPVIGADSSGTLRFRNNKSDIKKAQQHLADWLPEMDMMLQPYLPQVETFGETSAIYFAGSLSHAVRKVPVEGDYRVQDTFGAIDSPYQLTGIEMALAKACLAFLEQKFSTVLYARFDFLHGDEGMVFLNEAELIEPSLFFNHNSNAADIFAQSIKNYLSSNTSGSS